MNTEELSTRYKISTTEVENFIQKNIDELKNYIHYENGTWIIDSDSLYVLDKLIGFPTDKSAKKKFSKKSEPKILNQLSEEKAIEKIETNEKIKNNDKIGKAENPPHNLEDDLKQELAEAKAEAKKYADELAKLQDKFIQLQNGQEAMNSSFIKKHQIRAEAAEHELEKFKQKANEDSQYKEEQIKGLQARIQEMQEKLVENHNQINDKQAEINRLSRQIEEIKEDTAQRCSKAELKVLESKRSEEKLYNNLHETEKKLQDMNRKVNIANEERAEAIRNATNMRSEIIEIKSKLISITAGLSDYLTETETIADSRVIQDEGQIETAKPEEIEFLQEKTIEDFRNQTIFKNNEPYPNTTNVFKPKSQSLWQKVASFF